VIRPLPNGDMYAPHRGRPPECPDGYLRDQGDPFIFHPIINPCDCRRETREPCNCGTPRLILWCDCYNKKVDLGICKECQDANEGTVSDAL